MIIFENKNVALTAAKFGESFTGINAVKADVIAPDFVEAR